MKFAKLAIASVALAATPALANDQVVSGATVTGPEGNAVGTIVAVENGTAVLDTGKHKVPLAVDMYGQGETGPTITVTQAQLNSMIDAQLAEASAKLDAALVPGATNGAAVRKVPGRQALLHGTSCTGAGSGRELGCPGSQLPSSGA